MEIKLRNHFLASYVEAHGFKATVLDDGAVRFEVPCTRNGKSVEPAIEVVRTYREAREALGY